MYSSGLDIQKRKTGGRKEELKAEKHHISSLPFLRKLEMTDRWMRKRETHVTPVEEKTLGSKKRIYIASRISKSQLREFECKNRFL